MRQDETVLVFKDKTISAHVCLEGWDESNFLFDWREKTGWNHPHVCFIGGIELRIRDGVT